MRGEDGRALEYVDRSPSPRREYRARSFGPAVAFPVEMARRDAPHDPAVGSIERFMTEDHVHVDRLLAASDRPDGSVDEGLYDQFRAGLLRHIAMEEKVLLPFARARRGGEPLPLAQNLRSDHGEIAKLLARRPTPSGVSAVRVILERHNALEEGPRGLYAACDELAGDEAEGVVERLRSQPAVPLARYYDGPPVATRRHQKPEPR